MVSLREHIVFFVTGEKQNHEKTRSCQEHCILRGKSEIVRKDYFLRPLVCEANMSSALPPPRPWKELSFSWFHLLPTVHIIPNWGSISLHPPVGISDYHLTTFLYSMSHYYVPYFTGCFMDMKVSKNRSYGYVLQRPSFKDAPFLISTFMVTPEIFPEFNWFYIRRKQKLY
jgi:hypothetical protein